MPGENGNFRFPFRGISREKFYTEEDPKFYEKVEEISLCWKEEFDEGNLHAPANLLKEGGAAFFHVPWIRQQIRFWEEAEDDLSQELLEEIEEIVTDKSHGIGSNQSFGEKKVMLKEFDTYLHRFIELFEKRRRICRDCPRFQKDRYVVSCFFNCDFPERYEKLKEAAGEARRMETLFQHPPYLKALRMVVLDGEIFWKRKKSSFNNSGP